jgi:hypothetical protein
LKEELHIEAYESKFTMHPGSTKMYKDLKEFLITNDEKGSSKIYSKLWNLSINEG